MIFGVVPWRTRVDVRTAGRNTGATGSADGGSVTSASDPLVPSPVSACAVASTDGEVAPVVVAWTVPPYRNAPAARCPARTCCDRNQVRADLTGAPAPASAAAASPVELTFGTCWLTQ